MTHPTEPQPNTYARCINLVDNTYVPPPAPNIDGQIDELRSLQIKIADYLSHLQSSEAVELWNQIAEFGKFLIGEPITKETENRIALFTQAAKNRFNYITK